MENQVNNLQKIWEEENQAGYQKSDDTLLAGKHVIFFPGFMNEIANIINSYFTDNIAAVKLMGASTSYIESSSKNSIAENSEINYNKILKLKEKMEEKGLKKSFILVGHSKGGAELRDLILKHPELIIDGIVERVLVIQPVMRGSFIADNASGFLYSCVDAILQPNITTLTHENIRMENQEAVYQYVVKLKESSISVNKTITDLHDIIRSRSFAVRSHSNNLSLGLKLILGVMQDDLNRYSLPNDGLLSIEDQFDDMFTDLGVLEGIDHLDLTVSTVSNIPPKMRHGFTRAVFKRMYGIK